jgi:AcrR family transcriptional regulator
MSKPWRGTPLPPGRHKLPPAEVRASQRERLLRAMLEQVGRRGYAATTVPDVVAAARVSRNSFYALFEDKLDCFLSLCDEEAGGLFEAAFAARTESDWRSAVRSGVEVYLRFWQERPAFSRAYFTELPAAGPAAVEQRERASEGYRQMFAALGARAREEESWLPPMLQLGPRLVVAGVTELVAEEVRAGRTGELLGLRDAVADAVIVLIAGVEAAKGTGARPHRDGVQ